MTKLTSLVAILAAFTCLHGCRTGASPSRGTAVTVPESSPSSVEEASPQEVSARAGVGPKDLRLSSKGDTVVARIGEQDIRKSQVFDHMLDSYPDKVRASVAVLIGNRVLATACEKHSISVDDREIEAWYRQHLSEVRKKARVEYGTQATAETWLRLNLGQNLATYRRAAMNRERTRRLLERLVRYQQILQDRVELRLISLRDRGAAQELRRQVEEGADFAVLARKFSVHSSAKQDGKMIPLWRSALHPSLQGPAFQMAVGETSPIVHVRDEAGRDRYQIIKVIGRLPGREVSYSSVENEIMLGLKKESFTPDEWVVWQLQVNQDVELFLNR